MIKYSVYYSELPEFNYINKCFDSALLTKEHGDVGLLSTRNLKDAFEKLYEKYKDYNIEVIELEVIG